MAANSTLGINVYYAWQTAAGSRPTTGYLLLSSEIVEAPAYDNAAQGIDVTPLSETVALRRIPGLKDNGDDYALNANINQSDITKWAGIVASAASNVAQGKYLELMFVVPGYTDAYYMSGTPIAQGWAGAAVNEAFQGAYHITPYQDHGWQTVGSHS